MDHETLALACRTLPLFPLPGVVLMPGLAMPLHVFEPRYRRLVQDCLSGPRPFAVAQIMPGHEGEAAGRPPLQPYAGVGFIAGHRVLPDGRYDILLQPLGRVRLGLELDGPEPYRVSEAELLEDLSVDPAALRRAGENIRGRLLLMLERAGRPGEQLARLVREAKPETLGDGAAALVLDEPELRQRFLAENDPLRRARIIEDTLRLKAAESVAAAEA